GVRQTGGQEIDIVSMAKGITKYAKTILDENTIKYELEKAWHLANTGRKGFYLFIYFDFYLFIHSDFHLLIHFSICFLK
ncbi:MAG: hypothetical protein IIX48_10435, partial [Lachnospiraceae bacterium]|nr:hypothetical protein [Lachnospiraceae bacterium]